MFEKHIKNTKERILSSVSQEGKFVYLQDLLDNDSIEPAYKTYFKAEVAWWIYKEQLLREKNKNFDLDSKDIKSFYEKIDELYMQTARFDKNNIDKVTENAVKTNLNLLIRPQTTLKWFVFRGELTRNFYEIILRLDYFYHYHYLKNELISSFGNDFDELEQKIMVTAPEFSDALRKIDNQKLEEIDTDGFIELIKPIYEFFNTHNDISDSSEIPIEALILFFDDKNLSLLKDNTEKMLFESDIKTISIDSVREMLEKDASDLAQEVQDDENSISVEAEDLEDEMNIPNIEQPEEKEYEEDTEQLDIDEEAPIDKIENDITEAQAADLATKEVIDEDLPDIEEMESEGEEINKTDQENTADEQEADKDISEEDILDDIDIGDLEEYTEQESVDTDELPDDEEIADIEEMPLPEDVGNLEEVMPESDSENIGEDDIDEKKESDEAELQEEISDIEGAEEEETQKESIEEENQEEKFAENDQDELENTEDELRESNFDTEGKKVSGDYLKNIFESTYDMLDESETEDKADFAEFKGEADKEKVGEIIQRSLDFLKQEMEEFEVDDKLSDVNSNADNAEKSDEEELDEIEMMKKSLDLEEEENDNEKDSDSQGSENSPNLAEQIAKSFVEENDKEIEEAPLIDDDTEEIKDFIIEDFEDENDDKEENS